MKHNTLRILVVVYTMILGSLFTAPKTVLAQNDSTALPTSFGKGRMSTTEGREIMFSKITFDSAAARYTAGGATTERTVPMNKILRVEIQSGNNAALWALGCGALFLPSALAGVSGNSNSDVEISGGTKAAIVAGVTGTGVVIGAIIGAGSKTYKTIYNNHQFIPSAMTKKADSKSSQKEKTKSSDWGEY